MATPAAGTLAAAAATSAGGAPRVAAVPLGAVPAVTSARDQQVMLSRPFPVLLLCPSDILMVLYPSCAAFTVIDMCASTTWAFSSMASMCSSVPL